MGISQTKKISIIGIGYVGLPLLTKLSQNTNYEIVGFDQEEERICELKQGIERNNEILIKEVINFEKIIFSSNIEEIKYSDIYIVCVPTPISKSNSPDLSALKKVAKDIGKSIKKSQEENPSKCPIEYLIILESTLFPGATNEIFSKLLISEIPTKIFTSISVEFGYSPERVSPGRDAKDITEIVKLVAANNKKTLDWVNWFYKNCIGCKTHATSSIEVAEAAKILENTQRDLNIALVNECVHIFKRMNINTNEVIEAASTKWNFMPVYPGLVGGHCISVDPYYLTYKAQQLGYNPEVVLAGRRINDGFARWIAKEAALQLFKSHKGLQSYTAFVYGITFKANCNDLRNSKSFELIEQLQNYGIKVYWNDPLINVSKSIDIKKAIRLDDLTHKKIKPDLIIFCVDHKEYYEFNKAGFREFLENTLLIYDIPNILNFKNKNLISF